MDWWHRNNLKMLRERFSAKNLCREFRDSISNVTKVDLFTVLLLPIIATFIEILPDSAQNVFRLNIYDYHWWQFLTSEFAHGNFSHYFGNIMLFILIVLIQLLIVSKMKMKRQYFHLLSVTFIGFTVLSSIYMVLYYPKIFPNILVSCGASGIIAAMIGFMPSIFMGYISIKNNVKMVNLRLILISYFYVGITLMVTYAFFSSLLQIAILTLSLVLLLYLYRPYLRLAFKSIATISRSNFPIYILLYLMPLFFLIVPVILFPTSLIDSSSNSSVNVIVHYIGVIFGIYLGYHFFKNTGAKQPFIYHFKPKNA